MKCMYYIKFLIGVVCLSLTVTSLTAVFADLTRERPLLETVKLYNNNNSRKMSVEVAAYGSWKSPISSKLVAEGGIKLTEDIAVDNDGQIFWSEVRSAEGGRYVVCSYNPKDSSYHEWNPPGFNARTRASEYGEGAYFVSEHNGCLFFSNAKDNRMYKMSKPGDMPQPVTKENKGWMYADGHYAPKLERLISVREDHACVESGARKESENTIVAINPDTMDQNVLVVGADFYSSPRVSPDGTKLAWVQWNHPNMPWDSTETWVATFNENKDSLLKDSYKRVAGGEGISTILPSWSPDGQLFFISDQDDGWWNLFLYNLTDGSSANLRKCEKEIGGPQWIFGRDAYAFLKGPLEGKIATTFGDELGYLDLKSRSYQAVDLGQLKTSRAIVSSHDGLLYLVASGSTEFSQVVQVDVTSGKVKKIKLSNKTAIDEGYISVPEYITFPTTDNKKAYGYLYMPKNKDFTAPKGTLPPLLVRVHGGPTSAADGSLNLKHQYLTSRGFVVLDVDYRGSTGHGRVFREALIGKWGICDVEDVCNGAQFLVDEGKVNPDQLCIDGGSAGGYTTLAALAFKKVFKAGVSNYGVSDLIALTQDTHKFESRYMDILIGPYPEAEAVYKERSPINHVHNLNSPMAFFQGGDDKVVLPNQAEKMYESVKAKGLATSLVIFPEEQHGFRVSQNIQKAIEGEYYFFAKVFGFEPTGVNVDLEIVNLKTKNP